MDSSQEKKNCSETVLELLWNCSETALKIVRKRVVSPEAQTRTNEAKITVLQQTLISLIKLKNQLMGGQFPRVCECRAGKKSFFFSFWESANGRVRAAFTWPSNLHEERTWTRRSSLIDNELIHCSNSLCVVTVDCHGLPSSCQPTWLVTRPKTVIYHSIISLNIK